nr:MAG TPA: hypothetical protein [Caudoviricetes sp.]
MQEQCYEKFCHVHLHTLLWVQIYEILFNQQIIFAKK